MFFFVMGVYMVINLPLEEEGGRWYQGGKESILHALNPSMYRIYLKIRQGCIVGSFFASWFYKRQHVAVCESTGT